MAAKVSHLFTTNAPNINVSIGMSQFMVTLAVLRVKDAQRGARDPKAQRLEVEDAMALTNVHRLRRARKEHGRR